MCSYFEKGLNNTIPSKIIGLPDYVRIVKDSSLIEKFNNIRNLRINGNDDYKILKRNLPYITPSVIVKKRKLKILL